MNIKDLPLTELQQNCELLLLQNSELTQINKHLKEQIDWLKRQLFGKKAERFVKDEGQLYFPGFEDMAPVATPEELKKPTSNFSRKQAKSSNKNAITYPEDLPVETIVLDLQEDQKVDPVTGRPLVCIGEDIVDRLAKKAASFFIKKIIRKKYAVVDNPDEGIKTPDLPPTFMTRCAVDESIVADVLVKKFCDHLPLYRQAEILRRDGIEISKQTLSSYVLQSGKVLQPLYDVLEKEIKASGNIFIDETPVDVLAPGTGKTDTGYMITIVGGQTLNPALRVYKFFTNRKHDSFHKTLADYTGVFHSDKYGAYEKEAKKAGKIWVPCMAHVRRKYFEAESGDPKFREEVLCLIQDLFAIEEKGKNLSPEERVLLRRTEAIPILDQLLCKNKERLARGLLPKSKLTMAIGYFLSLAPYLKNYIEYPFARLDNNPAERSLKLVVIGRKNWMFIGSEGGGEASAVIYSLAQTCRALGINPQEYFDDVLRRIQDHPYNRLSELLPHRWEKL